MNLYVEERFVFRDTLVKPCQDEGKWTSAVHSISHDKKQKTVLNKELPVQGLPVS